jgi:hypothetical protein
LITFRRGEGEGRMERHLPKSKSKLIRVVCTGEEGGTNSSKTRGSILKNKPRPCPLASPAVPSTLAWAKILKKF